MDKSLLDLLNRAEHNLALKRLLPDSSGSYPLPENALHAAIINYLDAGAFGTRGETYLAVKRLSELVEKELMLAVEYDNLSLVLNYEERLLYQSILDLLPHTIESLQPEAPVLNALEQEQKPIEEKEIPSLLEFAPDCYRPFMRRRIEMLQRWACSSYTFPISLVQPKLFQLPLPWIPFSYSGTVPYKSIKETSAFLIEPYEEGWKEFFAEIKGRQTLLIFESKVAFVQMFQFPAFVKGLEETKSDIYFLDSYPAQQPLKKNLHSHLKGASRTPIENEFQHFCDLLSSSNDLNKIYEAALNVAFKIKLHRLGPSKAFALFQKEGCRMWTDAHKIPSYEEEEVSQLIDQESRGKILLRRQPSQGMLKVAHIVPQVVDGGHAPSRLLEAILTHHDQRKFELYLFSTETLLYRSEEYPSNVVASHSSQTRGESRLSLFKNLDIKIWIDDGHLSLIETSLRLVQLLKENAIDIAIFHGPDLINLLCSRCSDVPCKILFDHGTPSTYPAFDLVIFSSKEFEDKYRAALDKNKVAHSSLPFTLDSREGWSSAPFVRHQLGLPQDGFIMTTISNHLDSRLGDEMCKAIALILQRCPLAYYAPLGIVSDPMRIKKILFSYGVEDKIFFLGSRPEPSQYTRSMQLYLNEFPFGSGLGVLDAMAAGCPVITMCDPQGPPQANYGALYHGNDKAVKNGDIQGYIDLACSLYEDPIKYEQWSKDALQRYDQRLKIDQYMLQFEEIITNCLQASGSVL